MFRVPRAPGTHGDADHRRRPGAQPAQAIRQTPIAGLFVLTCGALPSNAANLLSGTRMRVLLQELREQFDMIVLDTPPVLATADAGIVASLTDGVLLVVRAGATDRNAAQRACQHLGNVGARVIGTVLNDPGGQVRQGRATITTPTTTRRRSNRPPPALTQRSPGTGSGPAECAPSLLQRVRCRLRRRAPRPPALGNHGGRLHQHVVFHRSTVPRVNAPRARSG